MKNIKNELTAYVEDGKFFLKREVIDELDAEEVVRNILAFKGKETEMKQQIEDITNKLPKMAEEVATITKLEEQAKKQREEEMAKAKEDMKKAEANEKKE